MPSGGYHPPANPAPVSGPGALSQRTDGGPWQPIRHIPDAAYGEDKAYVADQQGARLPQMPGPGASPAPQVQGNDPTQMVSMSAPSQRPDEPVTHGAALGAGAGPEALGLAPPVVQQQQNAKQFVDQLAATSGNPAVQYLAANIRGSF